MPVQMLAFCQIREILDMMLICWNRVILSRFGVKDTLVESAPSASDFPAVPSPTTTTLPATHPATYSSTTIQPIAEGLGFTGMPYPTYGVTPAATVPPMANALSEPVASSSTYTGVPEIMPRRYEDGYYRPAAGVYMTGGLHGGLGL